MPDATIADPPADWQAFRQEFPGADRFAYFDHAAVAPISASAFAAQQAWAQGALEEGGHAWSRWQTGIEAARQTAASVLGASPDELAFVSNTTMGISLVAEGLPWQTGDNVVVAGNEFPSNLYPWMNLASRGVETRRVAPQGVGLDLEALARAMDSRTRILSVSWVGYATGWRADLEVLADLARQKSCLFFLDAIQGLGVFPLNLARTRVDFLAADGHKWLLGPEGAGLLYVRREHLERLRPFGVGWSSMRHAHDFSRIEWDLKPTAARFEGGTMNTAGILALGASLDLLRRYGLGPERSAIADRVLEFTDLCCQRLQACGAQIVSSRDPAQRSGIVAFEFPGRDSREIRRRCWERQILLSCRHGWLRISPHAYNHDRDLARLLDELSEASR